MDASGIIPTISSPSTSSAAPGADPSSKRVAHFLKSSWRRKPRATQPYNHALNRHASSSPPPSHHSGLPCLDRTQLRDAVDNDQLSPVSMNGNENSPAIKDEDWRHFEMTGLNSSPSKFLGSTRSLGHILDHTPRLGLDTEAMSVNRKGEIDTNSNSNQGRGRNIDIGKTASAARNSEEYQMVDLAQATSKASNVVQHTSSETSFGSDFGPTLSNHNAIPTTKLSNKSTQKDYPLQNAYKISPSRVPERKSSIFRPFRCPDGMDSMTSIASTSSSAMNYITTRIARVPLGNRDKTAQQTPDKANDRGVLSKKRKGKAQEGCQNKTKKTANSKSAAKEEECEKWSLVSIQTSSDTGENPHASLKDEEDHIRNCNTEKGPERKASSSYNRASAVDSYFRDSSGSEGKSGRTHPRYWNGLSSQATAVAPGTVRRVMSTKRGPAVFLTPPPG